MFEIEGVHHVAIIVSDYTRSKLFYTEILGAKVIAETYRAERDSYKLDLEFPDGSKIELFSFPNPPKRLDYPEACGLRHLAFKVRDIESCVSYLAGRGVSCEFIRVDECTKMKYTFFKDPDGLPIEFYQID
ncbi:hypothetical protein BKG94_01055 [Rodentibacter ratti]|uniref:SMU1112c/YaeR family gloxylase I-like metalloprotein n=1 Tax=Rodentibacter ratti TaxID=1906745 RepID=UPI000985C405|nr:VOC family protein [Rodentibacter ratti]OOF89213.1 hypothetical protein BKG94_01055 [Rodentibacter ratti]